jgi:hypothetical protein
LKFRERDGQRVLNDKARLSHGRIIYDLATGRQLPPLPSVLYRIISKRCYILAAQLLLREKSGT